MRRYARSRERDRAYRRDAGGLGRRVIDAPTRLARRPRRRGAQRRWRRDRDAIRSGGASRAAASGGAVGALDQIRKYPLAMPTRQRRCETYDQRNDPRMSCDRRCERPDMTPRTRLRRIIKEIRFVFAFHVARPRLRGLKIEVARSDRQLRNRRTPYVVTEKNS